MSDDENEDFDEFDEAHAASLKEWELGALALFPRMPAEIQNKIVDSCDMPALTVLCKLNKYWYGRAMAILWRDIDFLEMYDSEYNCKLDDVERVISASMLFSVCDTLKDENPEHWNMICGTVRRLNLGRLHGLYILPDGEPWDGCDESPLFLPPEGNPRNYFDVIANFTHLEHLSVYIKNWWDYQVGLAETGQAISRGIKNLKSLDIGGQVSKNVMHGLLSNSERLENLSLINLICTPGQDSGPDGISVMRDTYQFPRLKILHLCKLADLNGLSEVDNGNGDDDDDDNNEFRRPEYASGMRWSFPRETEVEVLHDWATLLQRASSTLTRVTLENRYLRGERYNGGIRERDEKINPGETHPAEWCAFSIRESQRILFPLFASNEDWPKLEELTLVGMGETEFVAHTFRHLEPRVRIIQQLASTQDIGGSITPEEISTPKEFRDMDE